MFRLVTILMALTLLPPQALAAPPGPFPGPHHRPAPGGPPVPGGPRQSPLSFSEARLYAARAAVVARQLQAGELSLRATPQGQRLSLSLLFLGRPVGSVFLRDDLSFAERPAVPLLPDVARIPVLSSAERQALGRRVGALVTSGLAQTAGPQIRVALLSDGAAVADLHFDRATGILLAEPPQRGDGHPPGPEEPGK